MLFLHAAQTAPLGVPHFLKSAHRSGDSVRLRAERADETRALRVRSAFHDDRPAGLAELVQRRLQWNDLRFAQRQDWLRYRLCRDALYRHALRGTCPSLRCCPACCRPICPCRSHFFCSLPRLLIHREISCHSSFTTKKSISAVRRCVCPCACYGASSCPTSGKPMAFADDCPSLCLHRRRAGDPRGSWPHREPSV